MDEASIRRTVQPGVPAPPFDLPLVSSEGRAALADYRGTPLFLILLRSFECPFCRRQIAALKRSADTLRGLGIETLAVTTTPVKAARLYTRYRPAGVPLASDPALAIHRAYGVPIYRYVSDQPTRWPALVNPADLATLKLNPSDDLPEPMPVLEAAKLLDEEDGFEIVETDEQGPPDDVSPLVTYFLIDGAGTVRWVYVVALDDPADYARHPSFEDLAEAARAL